MLKKRIVCWFAVPGLSVLAAAVAHGHTINWGNALFDANFDSAGNEISNSTFTFELGSFSDGFAPTPFNTDQWATEWAALDSTTYDDATDWFTGAYNVTSGDAGLAGRQAYIWVYNNTAGDETSEWYLVTDDSGSDGLGDEWVIPAPPGGNPPSTYDWRVSTATTAVWGGLNGVPGNGYYTVDPGAYALQAFTFAPAVPEPSAAALLALAIPVFLRRRR